MLCYPGWSLAARCLMLTVRGLVVEAGMGGRVVTVNDVLGGHSVLDVECLDRVSLNAYVPILQSSGQVVAFMTQHLGCRSPRRRCWRRSAPGSAVRWPRSQSRSDHRTG
jgi:hypothetical protein